MASDENTYVTEVGVTCRGMPAIIQSLIEVARTHAIARENAGFASGAEWTFRGENQEGPFHKQLDLLNIRNNGV